MTKTSETILKCIRCDGQILRIIEPDKEPPWQSSMTYVCRVCGEHHLFDGRYLTLRYPSNGPVIDVSNKEARQWQSMGGCRAICGRNAPWA